MLPLRILATSCRRALGAPRVWLTAFAVVAAIAAVAVWPAYQATYRALDHHPGATFLLNPALDPDLARTAPETRVALTGGLLVVMVFWLWLGGGVLATLGVDRPFRFTAMLAAGGRRLPCNLRVMLLALVPLLLLLWGVDVLSGWLLEQRLRDVDPGYWPTVTRFGAELAIGFLFLLVVFAAKLAMAHLTVRGGRSALAAWLVVVGRLVRHPWLVGAVVAGQALIWVGASHAAGMLIARLLEVRQDLLVGGAAVVAAAMLLQVLLLSTWLAARAVAEATGSRPAEPPVP